MAITPLGGSGQTSFRGLPAAAFDNPLARALSGLAPVAAGRMRESNQANALIEALAGSGQQVPAGAPQPAAGTPTVARPGGMQTGQAGMMPQGQRALIEALAGSRTGRQALTGIAAEQLAGPEPITPFQEAKIGLQEQGLKIQREGQDLQREGLALRREQFESDREFQQAQLALEEAALGAEQVPDLSDTAGLRKEFTKQSEDFIQVRDAFGKVQSATEQPSPAGDLALIFNFHKMVDPGSVVREGEFATAAATGAFGERIKAAAEKLLTGKRLTDRQRQDFLSQAGQLMKSQLQMQQGTEQQFRRLAGRQRMDPDNVVVDFVGRFRDFEPAKVPGLSELEERGEGLMERVLEGVQGALGGGEGGQEPARQQQAPPAASQATEGEAQLVTSPEQYEQLPAGSLYRDESGNVYRKRR